MPFSAREMTASIWALIRKEERALKMLLQGASAAKELSFRVELQRFTSRL